MSGSKTNGALTLYMVLAGLFVSALVTSNLIFLKFFDIQIPFFGTEITFQQSVGLLPYPLTFIVTDIISEVFGRKNANRVVLTGFFASIFMLILVTIALHAPALETSPVSQKTFEKVFGLSAAGVGASMTAYLIAQFIDVRLFHFWKNLTKGKHLWLRNNLSTMFSQIVDTSLVLLILAYFDQIPWDNFIPYLIAGVLFKIIFAFLDTPIIYIVLYIIRKQFNLKFGEEISF